MWKKQLWLLSLLLVCILVGAKAEDPANSRKELVWTESSYGDFVDGTFSDAGANMYVSRRGRVQTINRWDLNGDGFIDLAFANSHQHAEKIDATIYWGNGKDFDTWRSSDVPTNGAHFLVPADLNGDSYPDLLVPNYQNGTYDQMDSSIYSNSGSQNSKPQDKRNHIFSPSGPRINLPGQATLHAAAADLNRDGYIDVVFASSGGFWEYRADPYKPYQSPSRIYWSSAEGFSSKKHTEIPTPACSAIAIADLNRDGWYELILARHESIDSKDVNSHIYWGGPQGFSAERRTSLQTRGANMVKGADFNKDGFLDLVFANGAGESSFVYFGGRKGFSASRRTELETFEARDVAVGDINQDGFDDVLFSCHQRQGNPAIQSFLYLGSALGFSQKDRIAFDTVGAWGVALGDLNEDGRLDVVVSNFQDFATYDIPSYIYWNSSSGFDPLRRTALFTHGAAGCAIADFDQDGHADLIMANTTTRYRGNHQPISVYWGNPTGNFTTDRCQLLPAEDAYELSAADLNDDGYPELVVANTGEVGRTRTESYIYWGGEKGFSTWRMSGLMAFYTMGISIADLDRDGYLDAVLASSRSVGDEDVGPSIYWGSSDGFVTSQRTAIPTDGTSAPLLADLNYDGHLDIAFASARGDRGAIIYWGDGSRSYQTSRRTFIPDSIGGEPLNTADVNRDGYLDLLVPAGSRLHVYWGNQRGDYTKQLRQTLPIEGVSSVLASDFNRDGWLDLVAPNYSTGISRAGMSRLFWGSSEGYSERSLTLLPSNGGAGSLAADFNRDGFLDLLIVCHRSEGDPKRVGVFGNHLTNSYLYWGGPEGFQADRKLEIPAAGPHYDYGVNLGNIYDRTYEFGYVSSVYACGSRVPSRIEWKGETAFGSRLKFQIRTAHRADDLRHAHWMGAEGVNTFYEYSGTSIGKAKGAWIQYRAIFTSPDGVNYPTLDRVSIHFEE